MSASARRKIVEQYQTIEQLKAKVAELEEENARLKAECDDIKQVQFPRKLESVAVGWKKQLAASQAYAEQLREKIETLWGIIDDIDSYGDMAKADDKLFRSLVEKRQKDRWETGITTDGYVLNMPIPHDTSAFDAYVANQREAAYQEARRAAAPFEAELARQRDLAVNALEAIAGRRIFIDGLASNVDIAVMTLDAIKESEEN